MPPRFKIKTAQYKILPDDNVIFCKVVFTGPESSRIIDLILDTGATISTMPRQTALAIGCDPIKSTQRIEMITASGIEYAPVITIPKIKLFTFEIKNVNFVCHDLPIQTPVAGLLGLNLLTKFNIHLDFLDSLLKVISKSRKADLPLRGK